MNAESGGSVEEPGKEVGSVQQEARTCPVCATKFFATADSDFCPVCKVTAEQDSPKVLHLP